MHYNDVDSFSAADMDRSMSYNYSSSTDIAAFTRQSSDTGFDNSYNTPNPFAAQTYAGAKQVRFADCTMQQ